LYSTLKCDVWHALLGGPLPVRSARGVQQVQVPAGSQHGDVLQLAGAGVAAARGSNGGTRRGHHFFTLDVAIPDGSTLPDSARDVLLRLRALQQLGGQ
jgi:molecular chaperone DnaJ